VREQGTRTIIDNTDTGLEVVPIMTRYDGAFDCYTTLVEEEGFWALYKGFGALLLQYALHMAILKLTRSVFELMSGEKGSVGGVKGAHASVHVEVKRDEVEVGERLPPRRGDYSGRYQRDNRGGESDTEGRYMTPVGPPRGGRYTSRDSYTTPSRPF